MAKLKINSTNPDYVGQWTKREILQEMIEVNGTCDPNLWLDWIFDHNFDDGYPNEVLNVLKLNLVTHVVIEAFINKHHTTITYDI